jgi:hypothetical protein
MGRAWALFALLLLVDPDGIPLVPGLQVPFVIGKIRRLQGGM